MTTSLERLQSVTDRTFGVSDQCEITPQKSASTADLVTAIDWLLCYEWGDDAEMGQALTDAAEFLAREVLDRSLRKVARQRGVRKSQLRFKD